MINGIYHIKYNVRTASINSSVFSNLYSLLDDERLASPETYSPDKDQRLVIINCIYHVKYSNISTFTMTSHLQLLTYVPLVFPLLPPTFSPYHKSLSCS